MQENEKCPYFGVDFARFAARYDEKGFFALFYEALLI